MRILPRSRSGVLTVSLLAGLAFVTLALVYRATRAAEPPIVLGYRDTPILLGPHEHWVTSIAFSPDGKTLATGAADGYLRFWDVASGKLHGMRGDDGTRGMHGLAFAPDGSRVAVVGGMLDKEVVFYETTAPAPGHAVCRSQRVVRLAAAVPGNLAICLSGQTGRVSRVDGHRLFARWSLGG